MGASIGDEASAVSCQRVGEATQHKVKAVIEIITS